MFFPRNLSSILSSGVFIFQHALSIQAGFRNSGITIRRKGKEGFAIHVVRKKSIDEETGGGFYDGVHRLQILYL